MRALLVGVFLLAAPVHVAAHCYSVWRFPWPQRCGSVRVPSESVRVPSESVRPPERPVDADIPLPGLSADDFNDGPLSDVTRARLELLGYSYAR